MLQLCTVCGVNYHTGPLVLPCLVMIWCRVMWTVLSPTAPRQRVPALKCPCWNNHGKSHSLSALAVRIGTGKSFLSCYQWFHAVHQLNSSEFANVMVLILAFIAHLSEHIALSCFFVQEQSIVAPSQFFTSTLWNCMSQQLLCGPDLHEYALWSNILPLNVCFSQRHLAAVSVWNMAHQM